MTIAVIIPLRNAGGTIDRTLDSLVAQTRPFDELIVVDDASSDDSVTRVEERLASAQLTARVQILRKQQSQGLAAAYNSAIREASSDIVVTVHSDVVPEKDALAKLVEPLENDPTAVASTHVVIYPLSQWAAGTFWQKCLFSRHVGKHYAGLDGKFDAFRRSVLIGLGLFDSRTFFRAGEDGDMVLKLLDKGKIAQTVAQILHLHPVDPNHGLRHYVYKHCQYAECQGVLLRRHGVKNLRIFLSAFFRELLIAALFIPYVRHLAAAVIAAYSVLYSGTVFRYEYRDWRILLLPLLNIALLGFSFFWSTSGFVRGRQTL